MAKERVSACMVLYRSGESAAEAVKCLLDSAPPPHFYLVDNASGDGVAERIKAAFPQTELITLASNIGFGRGNNTVLDRLESDYHLMLNPDVTFPPDLIARMTAYMDAHPDVTILTPRVMNRDGTEQFLPRREVTVRYLLGGKLEGLGGIFRKWRREFTWADDNVTEPRSAGFATGCFLFIRTAAFKALGGFDPRFFLYQEDSDLSKRVCQTGRIMYHPDMIVTHDWARENTRTTAGMRRQIRSIFKYFGKWGWKW